MSYGLTILALRDERGEELLEQDWLKPAELEGDNEAENVLQRIRNYKASRGKFPKLSDLGLDKSSAPDDTFDEVLARLKQFHRRSERVTMIRDLASALDESVEDFDELAETKLAYVTSLRREEEDTHWISFADIEYKPVDWLWQNWIPLETMTVVAGDGGKGKSTFLMDIVAKLSRGELIGTDGPGSTLIINAEDAADKIIGPRLAAAGADPSKVFTINLSETTIEFPRSLHVIEKGINKFNAKAVIVDPLNSFLPEKFDSHKDQSIRAALAPLALMAERTNTAFISVLHTNKVGDIMGSKAFQNLARSVLVWGDAPEDETGDQRILAHRKANYGKRQGSKLMRIDEVIIKSNTEEGRLLTTTKVEDLGDADISAEDILGMTAQGSGTGKSSRASLADKNRGLVLDVVREYAPIGGWEIWKKSGIASKTTVYNHLAALVELGMVSKENGTRPMYVVKESGPFLKAIGGNDGTSVHLE